MSESRISRTIKYFFSDEYLNKSAASNNIVQTILYRLAYRPSKLLVLAGLTPNCVTTLSLVCALISFASLVLFDSHIFFCIFWAVSLILDYCDGTVARITENISTTSFRYDHNSDLLKFALSLYAIALYYNNIWIWTFTVAVIFTFMMMQILSHDLVYAKKKYESKEIKITDEVLNMADASGARMRDRYLIIRIILSLFPGAKIVYENIRNQMESVLFNFNGHTLLLVLFMPCNFNVAITIYIYFQILCLRYMHRMILELLAIPR